MFVKGYAAPETEAATERARLLIKQAEAFGEPPEDPLLLYSVLYGPNVQKFIVFNGDAACTFATQFLALAEKQRATIPVMIGHGLLGTALLIVGDLAEGLAQLDRAMALYDPAAHRPLATRFGQDIGVRSLSWRPLARWMLGYPGPDRWQHHCQTAPGRIASSGRPDLISGRDSSPRPVRILPPRVHPVPWTPRFAWSIMRARQNSP
jgi:hypothetical protein